MEKTCIWSQLQIVDNHALMKLQSDNPRLGY